LATISSTVANRQVGLVTVSAAVCVNAAGANVTLRGLTIIGPAFNDGTGVSSVGTLHVEDVNITGSPNVEIALGLPTGIVFLDQVRTHNSNCRRSVQDGHGEHTLSFKAGDLRCCRPLTSQGLRP